MNEMFQAGVLCMFVGLKFDSLSMMMQPISLNSCTLFEVLIPLLHVRHDHDYLLRFASSPSAIVCDLFSS